MKKILAYVKSHRVLSIIVVLIFVGIILFFVMSTKNGSDYATYIVEKRDVSDSIQLAGTIDMERRVDLGFASSGRISNILVEEGEEVQEGQIIAELDQNQLQANLLQARANQVITEVDSSSETSDAQLDLKTVKAQQDALVQGSYQEYLSGDLQAYLDDDTTRTITSPKVTGSYLGSEEGTYRLEFYASAADSGYSYRLSGLESGTYTAQVNQPSALGSLGLFIQIDDASNYNNTDWIIPVPNKRSSTFTSRRSAYENALATRERILSDTQAQLNQVTGSVANISREEAQRSQARAQVNAVYAQLDDGKIRAPFDGIVARNNLEIGQIVNAYSPLITIFGSQERELTLNVPEIYINKVEVGNTVELTLDAYPDMKLNGEVVKVALVDTLVDGVPVYETTVLILDPNEQVRVGMNAKATVNSQIVRDVIAVPKHYLSEGDGETKVEIQTERNQKESRSVEIGFEGNDGYVEIISGLNQGDVIVRPKVDSTSRESS